MFTQPPSLQTKVNKINKEYLKDIIIFNIQSSLTFPSSAHRQSIQINNCKSQLTIKSTLE